ncbi:hypothetical protein GXP67_23305 [Rhodocytophaga rosea]|uniref:Uncharacterized protein n=1 Tax=Rhodocytophaga rosea TaxID=2704465 RepID=A0A6C0GN44_9BACT|nr:hypothetical protein [Rhodocytophaga rosea]QHT69357.1 hypothetical protein GXP67_23305 [Rhodocytophaga rosea]
MRAKVLKWSSSVLIIVGFIGFISAFPLSTGAGNITNELPWGHVSNIVADEEGNTYLGLQFYHRIQSYDKEGNFRKQWHIGCGSSGSFYIQINSKQQIVVATAKGKCLIIFDHDGNTLLSESDSIDFENYRPSKLFSYRTNDGTVYSLKNRLFIPKITKTDTAKHESVITQMPWYMMFIQGPLPAWLFFFLGMLIKVEPWKKRSRDIT